MACVENIPLGNADSEMEEGEIVDELDYLSDISSEEEFLLRQRLQVLENYNNVLERKKAKCSSVGSGKLGEDLPLHDLSEISGTDLEESFPHVTSKESVIVYRSGKDQRHLKSHHKQRKKKDLDAHNLNRNKEHKKKSNHKKRLEVKVICESSEESDDEYRNKRRKLANAVVVNRDKNDSSSLQARLQKMLRGTKPPDTFKTIATEDKETETDSNFKFKDVSCSPIVPIKTDIGALCSEIQDSLLPTEEIENTLRECELIDLCTDDDAVNEPVKDTTNAEIIEKNKDIEKEIEKDSDEDLELLREYALKTKVSKEKPDQPNITPEIENKPLVLSEDEDSDTAELRLICLKSALLKKAIEMKQKQKLQKRLSQSSNLQDERLGEQDEFMNEINAENNNTDIESVDMDIGSDGDDKGKDVSEFSKSSNVYQIATVETSIIKKDTPKEKTSKEEELEEDEDLLRARLLTSLTKNLPNLVDPNIVNNVEKMSETKSTTTTTKNKVNTVPEEKRIVINLGESDSEGENEATKNLTKMHMKLSEQLDFQQKLDIFLKSTRMEVEKEKLPDMVQKQPLPKTPQKFVAKVVNHLPKSEQIEYKNLVKRMAELEKVKQSRQLSMNVVDKSPIKETLKPRNVSVIPTTIIAFNNLEEQIALSRKTIAEESTTMLKLKEEGIKLAQKYKIVATELRNISTAITLNKKEQRCVYNRLSKIRVQHQRLLINSTHFKTNNINSILRPNNKPMSIAKLQKENEPVRSEYNNAPKLKTLQVSVVNKMQDDTTATSTRLVSVKVDPINKKTAKPKSPIKDGSVDIEKDITNIDSITTNNEERLKGDVSLPVLEKDRAKKNDHDSKKNVLDKRRNREFDDYQSPLQALGSATWEGDPNAILCPFEVGGNCKDPDCKYLHPKIPLPQIPLPQ